MKPHKFYVMKLVVEGRGRFPVDMLRYDSAVPATEEDAHRIEFGTVESEEERSENAPRRVTLRRFALCDDRDGHYAEMRWASYGWKVVTYDDEELSR